MTSYSIQTQEVFIVDMTKFKDQYLDNAYLVILTDVATIDDIIQYVLSDDPNLPTDGVRVYIFEMIDNLQSYGFLTDIDMDEIDVFIESVTLSLDNYMVSILGEGVYMYEQWVDANSILVRRVHY